MRPLPKLAARLQTLPEYPLANIPQRKRELLARGVDVIDLGAGDADLAPPEQAIRRLAEASQQPALQRYGFGLGHVPYREAAAAWMERRFGVRFDPMTELVPLIGSKEGISHLAFGFLEPGTTAIIPEPGYNAYQGGTLLAGAEPYRYALRPRTDFLVDLDEIPDDVLRRARILYLNYPNNPTAAIAPRDYLARVVSRCRELGILLVYDNAYSELAFDGYVPPSIFEIDGARDVAIEFHSLSKTYNMTGWRCGWAVARPEICAALAKVKSFTDTGQFMAVQAAGVAAIESWADFVPRNVAVFEARRDAADRSHAHVLDTLCRRLVRPVGRGEDAPDRFVEDHAAENDHEQRVRDDRGDERAARHAIARLELREDLVRGTSRRTIHQTALTAKP